MRVSPENDLEAEPCNLGVSKERTIEVVVEAVRVVFERQYTKRALISSFSLPRKVNYPSLPGFLMNCS
jgi:hypothetical protein